MGGEPGNFTSEFSDYLWVVAIYSQDGCGSSGHVSKHT